MKVKEFWRKQSVGRKKIVVSYILKGEKKNNEYANLGEKEKEKLKSLVRKKGFGDWKRISGLGIRLSCYGHGTLLRLIRVLWVMVIADSALV